MLGTIKMTNGGGDLGQVLWEMLRQYQINLPDTLSVNFV